MNKKTVFSAAAKLYQNMGFIKVFNVINVHPAAGFLLVAFVYAPMPSGPITIRGNKLTGSFHINTAVQ
jgi:hypothetical protein